MKSHAVSGPNKKNPTQQPTPLLERRDANRCPKEDPIERSFRKALSCLWAHSYLGHPSLGIRFPGMRNDLDQKMSLMPVSVSQRFPNFCCQAWVILSVASPHSGPGCSARQNSLHPISSKPWSYASGCVCPRGEMGTCKDQASISSWCGTTLLWPQQPRSALNVNALMPLYLVANVFYIKLNMSWELILSTNR